MKLLVLVGLLSLTAHVAYGRDLAKDLNVKCKVTSSDQCTCQANVEGKEVTLKINDYMKWP